MHFFGTRKFQIKQHPVPLRIKVLFWLENWVKIGAYFLFNNKSWKINKKWNNSCVILVHDFTKKIHVFKKIAVLYIVRQFHDFSVIHILREINFGGFRSSKNPVLQFLKLSILLIWYISAIYMQKLILNWNSEPLMCWNERFCSSSIPNLISRKISVIKRLWNI